MYLLRFLLKVYPAIAIIKDWGVLVDSFQVKVILKLSHNPILTHVSSYEKALGQGEPNQNE